MPYGRNQGQGHSREVDRQSPTGLIFCNLRSRFDLRQVELVFLLVVVIFFVFSIRGLKAMQVKKKAGRLKFRVDVRTFLFDLLSVILRGPCSNNVI